ncbi:uncharacterized protein B0H18DRAFT_999521, partial [Fomitopsis serialis]|uniref:uncharacterized protein n=1 Tax=Fomitopsis serialis TaxID=139415 RepID=UPI0020085F03
MRIKLQSFPPLPICRAWFSVHSATTVEELKSVLCKELPALLDSDLESREIDLVLDDFELLDFSPIDVIRDGDLILIKQRSSVAGKRKALDDGSATRKRVKRSEDANQPAQTKKTPSQKSQQPRYPHNTTALHTMRSSSSSSESISSSSSESSGSDSSSSASSSESESSSSDSDGSDSSSSAPSSAPPDQTANTTEIFVPPGLGKPATHSRNVRRRRKQMFERLATTAEPASVNEIPLGARAQTVPTVPPPAPVQAPVAQNGQGPAAQDGKPPIVFSSAAEEAAVERTLQEAIPFTNTEDREVLATFSRLVPPSEKQEKGLLPANMFVTSVDVEADLPRRKKTKKKRQEPAVDYEEDMAEDIELPYDDPVEAEAAVIPSNGETGSAGSSTTINREEVESNWSSMSKISEASQVTAGMFVAWKELGINPHTFTPEMLLNVGRVVSCEHQLVVEQHAEHAATEVSFGGLITTEDEQNVELEYDWVDAFQGDWRIIHA